MRTLRLSLLTALALLFGALPASAATVVLEAGTLVRVGASTHCPNGFNAVGHLLLAPGCGPVGTPVFALDGQQLGSVSSANDEVTVVRLTPNPQVRQVPRIAGSTGAITGSTQAVVGGRVCSVSRGGGTGCGTVTGRNQTVNYPWGTLTGLTRTSICVQLGDSWSPVYSGTQAQGHMIGGSGCTSYFLPINPALQAHGLTLLV